MAVIIQFEWAGLTRERFDEARARIRWEEEPAKGVILQSQGWDGETFKASDVWESEEDWNNFLQNRIMPVVGQMDVPGEPTVRVIPAYRVFSPQLRVPAQA
jgi:hypothetical protein